MLLQKSDTLFRRYGINFFWGWGALAVALAKMATKTQAKAEKTSAAVLSKLRDRPDPTAVAQIVQKSRTDFRRRLTDIRPEFIQIWHQEDDK